MPANITHPPMSYHVSLIPDLLSFALSPLLLDGPACIACDRVADGGHTTHLPTATTACLLQLQLLLQLLVDLWRFFNHVHCACIRPVARVLNTDADQQGHYNCK